VVSQSRRAGFRQAQVSLALSYALARRAEGLCGELQVTLLAASQGDKDAKETMNGIGK